MEEIKNSEMIFRFKLTSLMGGQVVEEHNRVMSNHFFMRVVSYVRNINIHMLLKFQDSIT